MFAKLYTELIFLSSIKSKLLNIISKIKFGAVSLGRKAVRIVIGFERISKRVLFEIPMSGFSALKNTAAAVKNSGLESFKERFSYFFGLLKTKCAGNKKMLRKFAATVAVIALLIVVGATNTVWSNLTYAVEVEYNGVKLGTISSAEEFDKTVEEMKNQIVSDGGKELITSAHFKPVITLNQNVEKPQNLAKSALNNTDGLEEAYGLFIDDKLYSACETDSTFTECINSSLQNAVAAASDIGAYDARYCENVNIKKAYYSTDDIKSESEISSDFSSNAYPLKVCLLAEEISQVEVPYETVENQDDQKVKGYKVVTSKGQNGVAETVSRITYIDGVEASREVVSTQNIVEPVAEQVTVGTATVGNATTTKNMSSAATKYGNSSFIWPVAKNAKMRISSYFGDGRNHKGFDICSPNGTAIFAAADGVVIKSGYNAAGSGYGNSIIIEHSNGLRTLYAHCETLSVSVGDVVKQGDTIATVGNTGNSSGNHLHFEVKVKGTSVDPAPYLGVQ